MKRLIIFFIVFATLFIAKDADSQQVTYSGPVEYKQIRTKIAKGSGSESYNWNVDIDEKYIIEGTFYVTFTGSVSPVGISMFQLTSIEEDIHFENTVNNEANEEEISKPCFDDKMKFTRNVSPGNSRVDKLGINSIRLYPEKPCITGGTLIINNGKYSMMLMGEVKADVTSIKYESRTFPCLDSNNNPPPYSSTDTSKMVFPIMVLAEKVFDGSNILEGTSVITDIHSTDCKDINAMTHGEVNCAYDENITVSWTLVKRTKECNAEITYLKGDLKINGVPAEKGSINIGAGDLIETGNKSRAEIHFPGDTAIRMGSDTQILLPDPCQQKIPDIKDPHSDGMRLIRGKVRGVVHYIVGDRPVMRGRTGVVGIRGQLLPVLPVFYASIFPFFVSLNTLGINPEKESLVEGYRELDDDQVAFYMDVGEDAIHDISALKGNFLIEDIAKTRQEEILEGSTLSTWHDGTSIQDVYLLIK